MKNWQGIPTTRLTLGGEVMVPRDNRTLVFITEPRRIKNGRSTLKRTCEVNAAGENSSFIFTVCVKSVPHYQFKLAYVVLQMSVKEFFKTHF